MRTSFLSDGSGLFEPCLGDHEKHVLRERVSVRNGATRANQERVTFADPFLVKNFMCSMPKGVWFKLSNVHVRNRPLSRKANGFLVGHSIGGHLLFSESSFSESGKYWPTTARITFIRGRF